MCGFPSLADAAAPLTMLAGVSSPVPNKIKDYRHPDLPEGAPCPARDLIKKKKEVSGDKKRGTATTMDKTRRDERTSISVSGINFDRIQFLLVGTKQALLNPAIFPWNAAASPPRRRRGDVSNNRGSKG